MIILDTCTLIFDALTPKKLTTLVKKTITSAEEKKQLFCCGISLWEIAMLIQKKRITVNVDAEKFLKLTLQARQIQVLPISLEIAALSANATTCNHLDPADRIIVATTIHHNAKLVTCDKKLLALPELCSIW